ncbi:MAG TPA: aminoglycoside phosphotransferase family protein [Phycisphaerales bacterium]|nr:aminoglycoside phosphotransferase family protein [Phycisphaerales bacterium]
MIKPETRPTEPGDDPSALARALEPALIEACEGRLSNIEWFHADWQRGGAATGHATWTDDREPCPVIIKLPVGGVELSWTSRLGDHGLDRDVRVGQIPHPTPRVFCSGAELGEYDLGWLVLENLEGQAVAGDLSEDSIRGLIRAAAEFHARSLKKRPKLDAPPESPDWAGIFARSRTSAKDNRIDEWQRWNEAIRTVQKALPRLLERWEARPINTWCHGDLHPGNALHMPGGDGHPDRCVLIDLALIHAGHWVEDAVYLEHLFWGHEDRLFGIKPFSLMRKERKARGLDVGECDTDLANIKRVLLAAAVPRFIGIEGDRKYVRAALEKIETLMSQLSKL